MTATPRRRALRRSFGNIRQLPSGRYQARYTGPDCIVYKAPVTFDTRGDADAWLSLRRTALLRNEWMPEGTRSKPAPTTLDSYSESWLRRRELKPRTREHYRQLLDRKILPALGDVPLIDLTPRDVADWFGDLDPEHPTARAHAYALLRAILATAVAEDEVPASPCRIRGAGVAHRVRRVRPATLAELETLTAAMPERYRALVLVSAWCALRLGEATELRRSDVDVKAGVIRVRRAVVRVQGGTVIGTPKSAAGARDVNIPPHLLPILRAHLLEHAAFGRDGLVFPSDTGEHLWPSTLYRHFRPARAAAGRPDLRWHDLRHTGAVLAAQSGATLAELMGRLGHSTVNAALRYQHAADGRDADLARRLSDMAEKRAR